MAAKKCIAQADTPCWWAWVQVEESRALWTKAVRGKPLGCQACQLYSIGGNPGHANHCKGHSPTIRISPENEEPLGT